MRIVAGAWRGRPLLAPPGEATRPTADRVRQALFDMLRHADWAEDALEGTAVDGFAGTGALGLEALSRGVRRAAFFERDRTALRALAANVDALGAGGRALLQAGDVTRPRAAAADWIPAGLVFLDPPYRQGLVLPALAALGAAGWLGPTPLVVAEIAADEPAPVDSALLAERRHGAARLCIWRHGTRAAPV